MYVNPDGIIKLLSGVPLDSTYDHTIFFDTIEQQTNFFINGNYRKYSFQKVSYTRVNSGVIRVEMLADNLYDCNYIAFQNSSFGSKWFYAFIKRINYINNAVSEIEFEIDVLQTWHFDYTLNECFIERQHVLDDTFGKNTLPENLEIGDYIYETPEGGAIDAHFTNYSIIVAASFDKNLNAKNGALYAGVFSGMYLNAFDSDTTGINNLQNFLQRVTADNKSGGIISIFMFPKYFIPDTSHERQPVTVNATAVKKNSGAFIGLNISDFYIPKNNKLYTYPYNFLFISDNNGRSAEYHFEYFSSENCDFEISGAYTCTPEFQLVPKNYLGVSKNYNYRLNITDFPQCSYNIDSYAAWLAQNKASLTVDTIGTGVSLLSNAVTLSAGGVVSDLKHVADVMATVKTTQSLPPQTRGKQSSVINISSGLQGYSYYYCHIRPEFAKIIDEYFERYGYAVHRNAKPLRNARPFWTYIKTVGCTVDGNVPADDLQKIVNIYNNGVTWWQYYNNKQIKVGDYTQDNRAEIR